MDIRLKTIASYIENGVGFIDVGTDHGYIPAELAKSGYRGHIFASDINPAPLDTARRTADSAAVTDRIRFLLCDGLALCPPEQVDTVVIAGMGGDTVCHIIGNADWCRDSRIKLILQPMTKAEVLRRWLVEHGFGIEREALAEDQRCIYQIIVARFGVMTALSPAELYTGKAELCDTPELFGRRCSVVEAGMRRAVDGMKHSVKESDKERQARYGAVLEELERRRKTDDG